MTLPLATLIFINLCGYCVWDLQVVSPNGTVIKDPNLRITPLPGTYVHECDTVRSVVAWDAVIDKITDNDLPVWTGPADDVILLVDQDNRLHLTTRVYVDFGIF